MTGIEVFANLVVAYEGTPVQRSRIVFGGLLIGMGTTSVTMLIVGPAVLNSADQTNNRVSAFAQTMDSLLPSPLPYFGILIGIVESCSAAAASALGLQNLALGLRFRHYFPALMKQRNGLDLAVWPVWIEVGIASACFIVFGTGEETLSRRPGLSPKEYIRAFCNGYIIP